MAGQRVDGRSQFDGLGALRGRCEQHFGRTDRFVTTGVVLAEPRLLEPEAVGEPAGIAASSFVSVLLEPALVSVCVALTSTTWPLLRRAQSLGVSVLADAHASTARALASHVPDRFAGTDWVRDSSGAVFIAGAALWLNCSIYEQVRAGDHEIAVLAVNRIKMHSSVSPIVFHDSQFHRMARSGPYPSS